ncbi:response regulator transcription factor [Paenibacillus sp. YIM B09110]|uniref:response regulator transcription factor n=1 Tax=Paenibacillus sp. YIM B09110 TaxID=3126102 RepID=UPI00301D0D0F
MYTVMLVDDEKGIIDGLKVIIPRYLPECKVVGYAHDGIDGVNMVRELHPDIVITDIRMLRKDGLEMVQTLVSEGVDSKFIILSGYSEFEYARKGMHLGVKFYLNKPIEEEELQHCVRSIIREIEKERDKEKTPEQVASPDIRVEEDDTVLKKKDVIVEIKQYIFENFDKNISLADLSNRFFINLHYLSQLFKEKTGQTYLEYLTQVRIERSKELLEKTELRIYEICQMVGYTDTTHFSKLFEKAVGCKPSEYKRMRIRK